MFFNRISQTIDLFQNKNFESDAITLDVDFGGFFLMGLSDSGVPIVDDDTGINIIIKGVFEGVFTSDGRPVHGPVSYAMSRILTGLSLKKTEFTCIGNIVDPRFLSALKKCTLIYLTKLTIGWEKCPQGSAIDSMIKVTNHFSHIKEYSISPVSTLLDIRTQWNLSKKISIVSRADGTFYSAKKKHLDLFAAILRAESLGESCLSLKQIACKYIAKNLTTYKDTENYKYVPDKLKKQIDLESGLARLVG